MKGQGVEVVREKTLAYFLTPVTPTARCKPIMLNRVFTIEPLSIVLCS